MNVFVYPVVTLLHLSNPMAPPAKEVTADYLGAGIGIEFQPINLSIEATIGAKSLGCVAPDCGRSMAGEIRATWRGRRR